MYLIDELPMRYDVNLFQIVLNLMEIMYLVQESMGMPSLVDWNLLLKNISSSSGRN